MVSTGSSEVLIPSVSLGILTRYTQSVQGHVTRVAELSSVLLKLAHLPSGWFHVSDQMAIPGFEMLA